MAIAGRVAIVPKGEYSNAVTYDKLDLVMFNNDAYVAKKASTGIEPTNDEYWMLILNNVVAEDLEKIIDGTTPVGNANKLGGKDASEYAEVEQIKSNSLWNELTIGFDLNNALGRYRTTNDNISNYLANKPSAITDGEIELEFLPADSSNNYGTQVLLHRSTSRAIPTIYARIKARDVWGEWQAVATTADLTNYLPLSGGRINGNLDIWSDMYLSRLITFENAHKMSQFGVFDNGTLGMIDNTTGEWIFAKGLGTTPVFNGTATGNLPNDYALAKNLSIGYLNMLGCTGFTLKDVNGKSTGHVGYVDGHFHLYNATASSEVTLLDTGNKPTGSYTGNGSSASRTISLGVQAHAVLIRQGSSPWDSFAIVTGCGSIIKSGTTINGVGGSCSLSGQNLSIASSDLAINGTGLNYTWSVLY